MFKAGGPVRRTARSFLAAYARYRPPELDRRFAALAEIARRADPALYEVADLTGHEYRVFSQNGEDGVLVEMLNRIGVVHRYFVEFGIQDGVEGNCVLLADLFGWPGLFVEADAESFAQLQRKYAETAVTTVHERVTTETFDQILAAHGVPEEPDVLSIDIDGNDVYVWDALQQFRPRIVVIEYNSYVEADGPVAQPLGPDRPYDGTGGFGSNLAGLERVAARKGYRLVHTDLTGTNAFFIRNDLVERLGVSLAPRRAQNFGLTGIHYQPTEPDGGWVEVD